MHGIRSVLRMQMNRRSVLVIVAVAGLAGAIPTITTQLIGDKGPQFPTTDELIKDLTKLNEVTGRDHYQRLVVADRSLYVTVVLAGGGTQDFSKHEGDDWVGTDPDPRELPTTVPGSVPIVGLPLDRLEAYRSLANDTRPTITIAVDWVGKVTVLTGIDAGLLLDGSGRVPRLALQEPGAVRQAVAEMITGYGTQAAVVGSFKKFVHLDVNVDGVAAGLRIARRPESAATAQITQKERFSEKLIFDPTGFDPTVALARKSDVGRRAGVEGKVWDWELKRPPGGGEPLVSYGIGPKGPGTRVWIDEAGKILEVVTDKDCVPGTGFCPG